MTTYFVDLGDGERVKVEASDPEAAVRKAVVWAPDHGALTDAFTALCGEEPDGRDAWTYTVTIEVVEQVHVRRSR